MTSGAQSKAKESKPKIFDGMEKAPEGWMTVKELAKFFKDELAEYETEESVIEEAGIRAALKPSKTSKGKVVEPAIRRGGDSPEAVKLASGTVVISPEATRVKAWMDKLEKIKFGSKKRVNKAAIELEGLRAEYEALKAEKESLAEELEALKKENEDLRMEIALVPSKLENAQLKARIALLEDGWTKKEK